MLGAFKNGTSFPTARSILISFGSSLSHMFHIDMVLGLIGDILICMACVPASLGSLRCFGREKYCDSSSTDFLLSLHDNGFNLVDD